MKLKEIQLSSLPLILDSVVMERHFIPRFLKYYKLIVCKNFVYKQNLKNIAEIPKLEKLIISITSKYIVNDKKHIIPGLLAVQLITGQRLKLTKAKQSIAGFKLRKNQLIGCKVTLQGKNMFYFLDKLNTLILPRMDKYYFQNNNIDSQGNYNLGCEASNVLLFPELENHFEFFEYCRGITISLITSTSKKKTASLLFSELQFPS